MSKLPESTAPYVCRRPCRRRCDSWRRDQPAVTCAAFQPEKARIQAAAIRSARTGCWDHLQTAMPYRPAATSAVASPRVRVSVSDLGRIASQ